MKLEPLEPLRPVLAQVRSALEARGVDGARSLTLEDVTPAQRRALAGLLGLREVPTTSRVKLSLGKLDAALRDSAVGRGLVDVVTEMFGALVDRRARKAEVASARDAVWQRARARVGSRPELASWLDDMRGHGRVARAATLAGRDEEAVLDEALTVAARLPAGGVLLPVFALELLGDAHALDAGRPLSALVLRAAAALTSMPAPTNAGERRRLWAEVGVACDSLSADVLSLGLTPVGNDLLARHLREATAQGEPRRTTLRELSRADISVAPGSKVFVCENPSVVAAAADRLGAKCRPLVCLEGVPSTAAVRMLKALVASGAQVRFHVDFDWGGVRIGNVLLEHVPAAIPWRLGTADYERSLLQKRGVLELLGSPIEAQWDLTLRDAMTQHALAVLEEQVLNDLLEDVAS